jgi:hypothetical protein
MYSPRWLFLLPGAVLVLLGMVGAAIALPTTTIAGVTFTAHTLLFSCLAILVGYQAILFAVFTKVFAISEGLMPEDPRLTRLFKVINLEKGLIAGAVALVVGLVLLGSVVNQWRRSHFGNLEYGQTMRVVISGATLTALGVQTLLGSFFASILGTHRK